MVNKVESDLQRVVQGEAILLGGRAQLLGRVVARLGFKVHIAQQSSKSSKVVDYCASFDLSHEEHGVVVEDVEVVVAQGGVGRARADGVVHKTQKNFICNFIPRNVNLLHLHSLEVKFLVEKYVIILFYAVKRIPAAALHGNVSFKKCIIAAIFMPSSLRLTYLN